MRKSAEDRFWRKVDKSGDCWIWTACRNKAGYGQFMVGGKNVKAHRYAYELENGPIPGRLLACHRCDNPPCCNPAHIFLGTHADNAADREAKGRGNQQSGIRNGHYTKPERTPRGDQSGRRKHPEAYIANLPSGERNGQSKLTEAEVALIRASYAAGGVTQRDLAMQFGVCQMQVCRILRGERWAHAINPAAATGE